MTEQEIRTLTCSIQEAYREMTGITAPPTIAEFLSMRSAAMEELKQGVHIDNFAAAYKPLIITEKAATTTAGSDPADKVTPPQGNTPATNEIPKSIHADLLQQEAEDLDKRRKKEKESLAKLQRPASSKVIALNKIKPPTIEEAEIKPEEESLSEFEILKRAGNPWN